jgi:hypothetical protein
MQTECTTIVLAARGGDGEKSNSLITPAKRDRHLACRPHTPQPSGVSLYSIYVVKCGMPIKGLRTDTRESNLALCFWRANPARQLSA